MRCLGPSPLSQQRDLATESLAALPGLLKKLVLTPLLKEWRGLFDVNGRLGLGFLLISGLVAYSLYQYRRRRGLTPAPSFADFLGGRAVWLHRSAIIDYQFFFLRVLLHLAFIVPIMAIIDPALFHKAAAFRFFENSWGARPRSGDNLSLMALYGAGVFLLSDFAHYWVHRAFHHPWLWEFHKVHHSATVMVPATAVRVHFVEKLAEKVSKAIILVFYGGVFYWTCGGRVKPYTIFGVSYLLLIFNSLAANLRHSHVWLSFGPVVEHIINSPAQHQIHHSRDPRHFQLNYGTNLSLWDWLFGTLYVTSSSPEVLEFGVGAKDNERYERMQNLVLRPFWVTARRLRIALPRLARRVMSVQA